MPKVIEFYRANESPYGVFSNLNHSAVNIDGEWFDSVEHAYQSKKPASSLVRDWLIQAPTPDMVATTAHALLPWHVCKNWSTIKYGWMYKCLRLKFSMYSDLKLTLVNTGDAILVEAGKTNNAVNRLWGKVNGKGRNLLGRMLMLLRSESGGSPFEDPELTELIKGWEAL